MDTQQPHHLKNYKKLVMSRFTYAIGLQMQSIILGWQMYMHTHDPLFLGFIGLAEAVPALGLALFSGYLTDRLNPLQILKNVVKLSLFSTMILVITHAPGITLSHNIQIFALFVSSFLTGISRSFLHPAVYKIAPQLIPRDQFSKSAAWMTSAYQTACIIGPAMGGLLFGFFGMFITASILTCLVAISLYFTAKIEFTPQPSAPKPPNFSLKKELLSGAKFVFGHPIMLPALTLDMVSVLFGGVTALLPIYAAEILFIGPIGLGILRASPAIGASAISLWMTRVQLKKNSGKYLLIAIMGFGISILVFAISKNVILSFIALLIGGGFDSISAVIRGTIVQMVSPDELRGRISSINMIFISSSNELGEFESGTAAKLLGTVPAAIFGGIICLLTVTTVAIFCPKLRNLNIQDL